MLFIPVLLLTPEKVHVSYSILEEFSNKWPIFPTFTLFINYRNPFKCLKN